MTDDDQLKAAIRAVLKRDPQCSTHLVIKRAAEALVRKREWTARTDPGCRFPTFLTYADPRQHSSFDRGAIRWKVDEIRAELGA